MLLPKISTYVSAEVSLFDQLVSVGEQKALVTLPSQLHLFLVGCLVDHLSDTEIVRSILALEFLSASSKSGRQGAHALRRTGDAALLFAGLFPERALRLNVTASYFRHLGQGAYTSLAAQLEARGMPDSGRFYDNVSEHFVLLAKVLQEARARSGNSWESFRLFEAKLTQ